MVADVFYVCGEVDVVREVRVVGDVVDAYLFDWVVCLPGFLYWCEVRRLGLH